MVQVLSRVIGGSGLKAGAAPFLPQRKTTSAVITRSALVCARIDDACSTATRDLLLFFALAFRSAGFPAGHCPARLAARRRFSRDAALRAPAIRNLISNLAATVRRYSIVS